VEGVYDREKSLERQIRAFHWVRMLAELPGRLAGSAAEREAAQRIEAWILELGIDEVGQLAVPSRPRLGWSLALHLGLGAMGCWLGGALGVLLTLLAAFSFWREMRGGPLLLSRWLPAPASVNVVGRAGSRTPTQRVVLSAHVDAAQAGWIFSERLVRLFASQVGRREESRGAPPGPHALPYALLLAAAGLALAAWLGADGILVGALRFLVGASLAVGCVATLEWGGARPSPGANDDASGVAAMLTCAEQLLAQLPEDTELWVVGSGAEEVGCCGMRAFCEDHPDWSRDATYFVNFECTGGGALHYVRSEGTLERTSYPPLLLEIARRVAASGVFHTLTPTDLLAGSDGHVPARRGFPTLSLISLEENGVPRNYHRSDDLPEALDMATVVRAADFAAAVTRAALRGEAGPIAIV
jgi:hypothetical protein